MLIGNVTIVFEGLFLFCNPALNGSRYCEVGLHSKAPGHSVKIGVFSEDGQVELQPVPEWLPKKYFSHDEIRTYDKLFLYQGASDALPRHTSVAVEDSFTDYVLDIQGPLFYERPEDKVDVDGQWYKPSLFILNGSLFAPNDKLTLDGEFCRLDESTMDELNLLNIRASQLNTLRWAMAAKKPLGPFARQVAIRLAVAEGQSVLLRGGRNGQVLFKLPHPAHLGVDKYQIKISNLDDLDGEVRQDADVNCRAFAYHSLAFKHEGKPNYGLYPANPFISSLVPHSNPVSQTAGLIGASAMFTGDSRTKKGASLFTRRQMVRSLVGSSVLMPTIVPKIAAVMATNFTASGCCLSCRGRRTRTLLPAGQAPLDN